MTVEQILYTDFVEDDTEIILYRRKGRGSTASRWYYDDILDILGFADCEALEFAWNGDKNRVTICILEEEEEEEE